MFKYAYVSSYVGCTHIILFTCIINRIQEKKTNHLHTSFSYHIHIVTFGSVNMYTIHKTTYNITTTKEITNTLLKVKPNFYLLGKDFVYESTSIKDMEILFKQLKRLTKVAPVYFVYCNHENKTKFSRTKLNQEIIKNNITILNDQEVHLNNITLIGRKDYHLTNETYSIVLDHQPQGTKENIKNNVDLQLSGHTHNGQMFPLSYSYHLQPDFAGNYGKKRINITQKSLAQALLVGVFL